MLNVPTIERPYALRSPGFWRAYLVLMRPYLLFVSGITGIAGMALVPDVDTGRLLVLIPLFFSTYGFGQALTDCFQTDTDALSSPYRPLVRGEVRRSDVLAVSLGGLIAAGVVLGICSPATLPLAGLCIAGLATYTHFKRKWWGGPFYNAWIVAALFIIAYLAGGGPSNIAYVAGGGPPAEVASSGLWFAAAAVFFGYANFVLSGYFKDVSADAATGYDTLPVRFGRQPAAIVSDVFAALTVVAVVAFFWMNTARAPFGALVFAAAGIAASIVAQLRLHRVEGDADAHRAIGPVVHAYILLLSAIAAAAQPAWSVALTACYAMFVLVLRRRPMQAQI